MAAKKKARKRVRKNGPVQRDRAKQRAREESVKESRARWARENPGKLQGKPGLIPLRGRQGQHTGFKVKPGTLASGARRKKK